MKEWITEFKKYLTNSYPMLESSAEGLGLVDEFRAVVCENISLYMKKIEEEFKDYLNDFAQEIWTFLGIVSQSSSRDILDVTKIEVLTTVNTSVHNTLPTVDGVIMLANCNLFRSLLIQFSFSAFENWNFMFR